MIPKIIHYCWFGGKPLPESVKRMKASWMKHMPDYEIKQWDESNINIHSNQYMEEAYREKKWAFVSDYVRLEVLKKYGGIYLDTDVEVFRSFDIFLSNRAFCGMEDDGDIYLATCIIGAEKEHPWIVNFWSFYQSRSLYLKNGDIDMIANTVHFLKLTMAQYPNFQYKNVTQVLDDGITIYDCSLVPYATLKSKYTNYYAIHHADASWFSITVRIKHKIILYIRKYKWINKLYNIYRSKR